MDFLSTMRSKDARIEKVEVPGFGTVYVRAMDGYRRDAFDDIINDWRTEVGDEFPRMGIRGLIIACCMCDENGKFLYEPTQYKEFAELDAIDIAPIYDAARVLNRFVATVTDAKK